MTKTKKIIIIFSILSLISIVFLFIITQQNKKTSPIILSETGASYSGLTPNKSSIEDITKTLGPAINEYSSGSAKILEYSSKNPNFNNEFQTKSDKLEFVKQIVTLDENINIASITKEYGNYSDVLYNEMSVNGFNLYIYPSKGIAYVGHQASGIVLEIWYFPPTTIEGFQKLYASSYSKTPPTVQ